MNSDRRKLQACSTEEDYSTHYLTVHILENSSTLTVKPLHTNLTCGATGSYSTDDGVSWTNFSVTSFYQPLVISGLQADTNVLFKGSSWIRTSIVVDKSFNVSGNVMSLYYGDNFIGQTAFPNAYDEHPGELFNLAYELISAENLVLPATTLKTSCYGSMFNNCISLVYAPKLSATSLSMYCYYSMFYGCTSLVSAPELPAISLDYGCYAAMFQNCTSLVNLPELNATSLEIECYHNMFNGCTSLTSAPALPATTLADNCYQAMFYGCTSLTTAPNLPATTLAEDCYSSMFYGCSSLSSITALFTTTPGVGYTEDWVYGVASSGTFYKNRNATWDTTDRGDSTIPYNWTIRNAN